MVGLIKDRPQVKFSIHSNGKADFWIEQTVPDREKDFKIVMYVTYDQLVEMEQDIHVLLQRVDKMLEFVDE